MAVDTQLVYLLPAWQLAEATGLFASPGGGGCLQRLPDWLKRLESREGVAEFERLEGIVLPEAVREFYQTPSLVCLVQDDGGWMDRFRPPEVYTTDGMKWLSVWFDHHNTITGAVPLDGRSDPPIYTDFSTGTFDDLHWESFSGHILALVEGVNRSVQSRAAVARAQGQVSQPPLNRPEDRPEIGSVGRVKLLDQFGNPIEDNEDA
jgi:hypothetical protein